MNKIKLMVIDDNKEFCSSVRDYAKMKEEIDFCGAVHDGITALEHIRNQKPDVILLDNVMPDLDGMGVATHLQSFEPENRPEIVAITACPTDSYMSAMLKLGVSYIMSRKNDVDEMIERCIMVVRNSRLPENEIPKDTAELITSNVSRLGVPANVKGYPYLREAIKVVTNSPERIYYITKDLYVDVAKKYNTTAEKVERNIRNAIEIAWSKGDKKAFEEVFETSMAVKKSRPTNSEFIAKIADRIRMELRKQAY